MESVICSNYAVDTNDHPGNALFFVIIPGTVAPPSHAVVSVNIAKVATPAKIHHPVLGVGFNNGVVRFDQCVYLYTAISKAEYSFYAVRSFLMIFPVIPEVTPSLNPICFSKTCENAETVSVRIRRMIAAFFISKSS